MLIKFIDPNKPPVELTDLYMADLRGADLYIADLHGADLHGADLYRADLRKADLRGADLYITDLHGADLRGADLCGADLRGADLCRADLRGADLRRADLCGADLRETDLHCITMNWNSHELIARRIFNETTHREIAGLILISKDWCWKNFIQLIPTQPHAQEIINFLKSCIKPNDNHPSFLDK